MASREELLCDVVVDKDGDWEVKMNDGGSKVGFGRRCSTFTQIKGSAEERRLLVGQRKSMREACTLFFFFFHVAPLVFPGLRLDIDNFIWKAHPGHRCKRMGESPCTHTTVALAAFKVKVL